MQLDKSDNVGTSGKVGPALHRLRLATRASHDRLESIPCFARLMRPDITKSDYISALQVLYRFHAAYTDLIVDLIQTSPGVAELPRSSAVALIAADLEWLGAVVPKVWPALFEPPSCMSEALGALYVVEGSLLGGRVIGRHVALNLSVGPHAGGDFFCSASADIARTRWCAFCMVLEQSVPDEDSIRRVCKAASAAFKTLELWMRTPMLQAAQESRFAA